MVHAPYGILAKVALAARGGWSDLDPAHRCPGVSHLSHATGDQTILFNKKKLHVFATPTTLEMRIVQTRCTIASSAEVSSVWNRSRARTVPDHPPRCVAVVDPAASASRSQRPADSTGPRSLRTRGRLVEDSPYDCPAAESWSNSSRTVVRAFLDNEGTAAGGWHQQNH
ncbi:unnamed protein product, partial [Iphiclides podalirius]